MDKKNKKGGKKSPKWPKRERLEEAINVVWKFKYMCKHQLDLGYWVTMDYPTKHHINKILSLQYMDRATVEAVYGPGLTKLALELIPSCKHYIAFTKDHSYGKELENE